jgi:hypothetical protein
MEKPIKYFVMAVLISALAGCGLATKEIKLKSQSEKTDVFREVTEEGLPPKGFVDLLFKTSIKTHMEGYYFIEPEETFHGQEEYPILINIDGQAITWKLKGLKEIIPIEKGNNNPEKGEGVRYSLNKRIRLTPGPHKFFFGLPGEGIYKEINLTLIEGSLNLLEFKPRYGPHRGRSARSFEHGVEGSELFLNGNPIR